MKKRIKKIIPKRLRRQKTTYIERSAETAPVPRITNETVAEHREEVLKGARKYIYPLQHSKHRIIIITTAIVIVTIIAFLSYCVVALYKLQSNNTFLYRVTQVVPFPVARSGGTFISYENYLFELRHYVHYYETQLDSNFENESERQQLQDFKKRALDDVINNAYLKKLAAQNGVSVSGAEVNERIKIVREQNRLGSSNRVFEDVLRDFWGWSVRDFERSVKDQILAEKVVAKLDVEAHKKAEDAYIRVKSGEDFAKVAKEVSADPQAKTTGGDYGIEIDKSNRDVPPQVIDALFKLQPGGVSEVINTGTTLEIVKLIEFKGNKVRAAHIVFELKDPASFINDLKEQQPARVYINL